MTTYEIIRFFRDGPNVVMATGLTLEEAQAHCRDPETSSITATEESALRLTAVAGPWFDGYQEETYEGDA
jgi:hypothetical protein